MRTNLSDLDELILTVRDPGSASYIAEAVDAYRAGAHRAAIVTTWIAVVYDLISKIRELALQGDRNASAKAQDLDGCIASGNIQALQSFEAGLLGVCWQEFEFVDKSEHDDLDRLQHDRHKCAHPAFVREGILFDPGPERTRMYIVQAVTHLLQHPPTQGKSAIAGLISDLTSATFPSDDDTAREYIIQKYLVRAKPAFVRSIIGRLLKALLQDDVEIKMVYGRRMLRTLEAVACRHPDTYREQVKAKLPLLVNTAPEHCLPRAYVLLGSDPAAWPALDDASRLRLIGAVEISVKQQSLGLAVFRALRIPDLRPKLLSAFGSLARKEQIEAIKLSPQREFVSSAIKLYAGSVSYRDAESVGEGVMLQLLPYFAADDVKQILTAVQNNRQVWDAGGTPGILVRLLDGTAFLVERTREAWQGLLVAMAEEYVGSSRGTGWEKTKWAALVSRLGELGVEIEEIPSSQAES